MTIPVMPGYGFPPAYGSYPPAYGGGYGYTFAPMESPPPTPFEQQRAELYRHEEGTKGMLKGAAGLGLAGAASGALAGAALMSWTGPGAIAGAAVGAVIGGLAGLFGGGAAGKKLGELRAIDHDAIDNGKLDGSPLLLHASGGHGAGASPYGFEGAF